MKNFNCALLTTLVGIALTSNARAAAVLYYNFEQASSPSLDQVGNADVTWGAGGSSNASSPLGDTLGSSFSSTDALSVVAQANAPAIGTGDFSPNAEEGCVAHRIGRHTG